ncbi:MAG TPA: TIGR04222 domain-containing membrane protein [Humisphaera sp.]|jgi:uncharacterized protein (TIGR04222 family)|nr:TIGR04222 domain-containing membrane protein [Humisphaera sp.]
MNILDLRGPEFLQLYAMLLGIVFVTAIIIRWLLRGPGGDPGQGISELQPLEIAYLAGGRRGAIDAAIAGLFQRGVLTAYPKTRRVRATGELPPDASALERALLTLAAGQGRAIILLRMTARSLAEPYSKRLRDNELLIVGGNRFLVRLIPAAVMLVVLGLGIAKIVVGVGRHKPIEFLGILCVITFVIALIFAGKQSLRTRRGDAALSRIRANHAALRTTARSNAAVLSDGDVMLAFALFGPAILVGDVFADLRNTLVTSSSSGGDGGSSCSGGGGCGGGGCGGCGGG